MDADNLLCFNAQRARLKLPGRLHAVPRLLTMKPSSTTHLRNTTRTRCCNINKAGAMSIYGTRLCRSRARAGDTSQTAIATSEDAVERELSALMCAILAGYHKKQVWSHKIWKGVDIRPVGGAGCQHGRVPCVRIRALGSIG